MPKTVKSIQARQIFDAAGHPTVSGTLSLSDGTSITVTVPNISHPGSSTSHFLFDEEKEFFGKGVSKSVSYINDLIGKKLIGVDPLRCVEVDQWLLKADTSPIKETLGANSTYCISQLMYQAAALISEKPLYVFLNDIISKQFGLVPLVHMPTPIIPMITGGSHGSSTLNFQEFSLVCSTSKSYSEAFMVGYYTYHELLNVFAYRNIFSGYGSDGAYIPSLATNGDAFEIIREALLKCGYKVGFDVYFALDFAADFYYKGKYYISDTPVPLGTDQMLERIVKLTEEYRSLVLEDPFSSKDENGWKGLVKELGSKVYIAGDDLTQTNKKRIEHAADAELCNAICIKPIQRGTILEAMDAISVARDKNCKVIVSQSSVESNDTFLADFSVAVQADFVKFGSLTRGERIAKHNRMLELEENFKNG